MSRFLMVATTICTLTACGSSSAAPDRGGAGTRPAPGPSAHCGPSSARTLGRSASARVYVSGANVFGCAGGSGHRYRLGTASRCIHAARVGAVAVAGRMAAYSVTRCGVDTGSATVDVRRLTDGKLLYEQIATAATMPEGYTSVAAIVASRRGGVAWIAQASSIVRHSSSNAVYVRRGSGAQRLDASGDIVAQSLSLNGSNVSWRDGSRRRSAGL